MTNELNWNEWNRKGERIPGIMHTRLHVDPLLTAKQTSVAVFSAEEYSFSASAASSQGC